jgi:peptidoglycan-associated lipoprotein
MQKTRVLFYGIILLVGSLVLWGCPKKTDVISSPESRKGESASPQKSMDVITGRNTGTAVEIGKPSQEGAALTSSGLKPVYFDYDKSFLRTDALKTMADNIVWLKANPKLKVRIEGNCDERGTAEYNQALGQRRSANAKTYLIAGGISSDRISLISYGKEKSVCTEHTDACWQKDRRDDFIVIQE